MDSIPNPIFTPQIRQQFSDAASNQAALAALPPPQIAPLIMDAMPSLPVPQINARPRNQMERDQDTLNSVRNAPTGGAQLHNPFLKGLARTADVLGSVFAPGLSVAIPGTTLHHQVEIGRAEANLANDQATQEKNAQIAQTQANTEHTQAETPEVAPNAASVRNEQGATARHLNDESDSLEHPLPQFEVHDTESGPLFINKATGEARHINVNGIPVGPKLQTKTVQIEIGGKPHQVLLNDATGDFIKDLGESGEKPPSVSMSTGTYSVASVPDGKGGMKSVLLNNKTGAIKDTVDGLTKGSGGTTPTVADRNRASLAKIALGNLDKIQEIVQRRGGDLFGPGPGRVANIDQIIGSNDPDLVALVNEAHNFSMANAGIHGSRSVQNVRDAVKDLLGDFHNGPQGVMGGLNANRSNLNDIMNPKQAGAPATEEWTRDASGKLVKK